jgi:hypothetical protein
MATTFSGYLVDISKSPYTASFDQARLADKLKILPVSGISGSTLAGFLSNLAATTFIASGWPEALNAQKLVPGQNIPAATSNEAGLLVVGVLLARATGAIPGTPATALPQAILDRLNDTAVAKDFIG